MSTPSNSCRWPISPAVGTGATTACSSTRPRARTATPTTCARSSTLPTRADCSSCSTPFYNHLGPDGNYLGAFSKNYFNSAHKTPWGDALNFDGAHNRPVRQFFFGNIVYWMEEFRFDGFRLDASHAIIDQSDPHILAELAGEVHRRGGFVMAEDERNAAFLAEPASAGGSGLDGLWADDFHHVVRVALTGEQEAYLKNFTGTGQELADTLANGWYFRGQVTPTDHKKTRDPVRTPAAARLLLLHFQPRSGRQPGVR